MADQASERHVCKCNYPDHLENIIQCDEQNGCGHWYHYSCEELTPEGVRRILIPHICIGCKEHAHGPTRRRNKDVSRRARSHGRSSTGGKRVPQRPTTGGLRLPWPAQEQHGNVESGAYDEEEDGMPTRVPGSPVPAVEDQDDLDREENEAKLSRAEHDYEQGTFAHEERGEIGVYDSEHMNPDEVRGWDGEGDETPRARRLLPGGEWDEFQRWQAAGDIESTNSFNTEVSDEITRLMGR